MTKEQALAQSKLEAENANLRNSNKSEKEQQNLVAQKAHVEALQSATKTWEDNLRSKDPDFDAIEPSVMDAISAAVTARGGQLPPLAELPAFLDENYKKVKSRMKGMLPARKKKEIKKGDSVKTPKGLEQKQ